MANFWDSSVWGAFNVLAVLLLSLLLANMLKRTIPFLQASLIPTSVLGGAIILLVSSIFEFATAKPIFNTEFFGGNGFNALEIITYHALALGFIASTFRSNSGKITKQRAIEIFNTGVTTVATYLLQAVLGLLITIIAAMIIKDFFAAAGLLLPFGYGQGTGQALNYGTIYENDFGFIGGKSFGLTIAALGFLSASIGGVIHLNIMKKRGFIARAKDAEGRLLSEDVQDANEIPMNGSMDKLTVQIAIVAAAYFVTNIAMFVISSLVPGFRSVIYGFNFLIGVLIATAIKAIIDFLNKKNIIHRRYTNNFLLTRISNTCFDIMVVAGIAAIRLSVLENYWVVILIMGIVGLASTYIYNSFVAKKLFHAYENEQFLMMYGMLTGTASTGTILLREIDEEFKTPAADNMIYQNFPAIVFGFPIMLLATFAPTNPPLTLLLVTLFFIVMNIILFRASIFKKKK